jgi:methyl-accepting chemotaxis protein
MKSFFRKKYFIEKQLQTKVILFTILLLMIYTLLFVAILFIPYLIPLSPNYSMKEQTDAARMVLSLHQSVWPALAIVSLILGFMSIFISHKVAGPVYRIKRSLVEIAGGNINLTIRLRKRDELHDLADCVNLVTDEMRGLVKTLQNDQRTMTESVATVELLIEQHHISEDVGRELLEKLQASRQTITQTLAKYSVD